VRSYAFHLLFDRLICLFQHFYEVSGKRCAQKEMRMIRVKALKIISLQEKIRQPKQQL
jgi:hypothetical protein